MVLDLHSLSRSVDEPVKKTIIIVIMYIYHALINALSAHMIHINLCTKKDADCLTGQNLDPRSPFSLTKQDLDLDWLR